MHWTISGMQAHFKVFLVISFALSQTGPVLFRMLALTTEMRRPVPNVPSYKDDYRQLSGYSLAALTSISTMDGSSANLILTYSGRRAD